MNFQTGIRSLTVLLVVVIPIPFGRAAAQEVAAGAESAHGILSGRVIFQGVPPQEEWVPVQKHRTFCGERRPLGRYRVSPSGGVENVAVLLEAKADILSLTSQKKDTVFLDNRDCEFLPRVQVTRPDTFLDVRNSDPILHTAHAFQEDGRTIFHVALPHFRDRTRTRLPRSGLLRIVCDVGHTWMRAYILVSPTPLTAVTGPEGTFEIRNIPSGDYRLRAWHETFGEIERRISVAPGDHTTLTLVFSPEDVK